MNGSWSDEGQAEGTYANSGRDLATDKREALPHSEASIGARLVLIASISLLALMNFSYIFLYPNTLHSLDQLIVGIVLFLVLLIPTISMALYLCRYLRVTRGIRNLLMIVYSALLIWMTFALPYAMILAFDR